MFLWQLINQEDSLYPKRLGRLTLPLAGNSPRHRSSSQLRSRPLSRTNLAALIPAKINHAVDRFEHRSKLSDKGMRQFCKIRNSLIHSRNFRHTFLNPALFFKIAQELVHRLREFTGFIMRVDFDSCGQVYLRLFRVSNTLNRPDHLFNRFDNRIGQEQGS